MSHTIYFTTSFENFLWENEGKSKVCRLLLACNGKVQSSWKYHSGSAIITNKEINYITFRTNGTISYLPAGKEHVRNDNGTWAKDNRQEGKPAKVLRKLFTKEALKRLFKDSDFEIFANVYKSKYNGEDYTLSLRPNIEIPDVYCMNKLSGSGSLNNSCMNGDRSYLEIYANCPQLQILTLTNKEGLLCGRSLVWKVNDQITFMDRIYVVEDFMFEFFLDYCEANKFWKKKYYKTYDHKDLLIDSEGNEVRKYLTIKTNTDFDEYPYIDTFSYGGEGYLTNNSNDQIYTYNETGGERSGGEDDRSGQRYDDLAGDWISEDDAIYIECGDRSYRGRTTHVDNCVMVGDNWYHENDSNIVEVNGTWYTKDDDDIVYIDSEDEYYHKDDCVYCERDDKYYLESDCVYSEHESAYILKSEAYEVAGNYYHEDDVCKVA